MIKVFDTAEDLESISDLHTLCNMMTIIREWGGSSIPGRSLAVAKTVPTFAHQ